MSFVHIKSVADSDLGTRDLHTAMAPISIALGSYPYAAPDDGVIAMDDEELSALAEKETFYMPEGDYLERLRYNSIDAIARENAINWILKVGAHYGFRPETAALSVNYLDRFLSRIDIQKGRAWMMQLASVACLSLAAKMEETEAPLLLDLQVEEAEYIFESRTVQRMELLLLGTLEWRMIPVTPLSYLDYGSHLLGLQKEIRSAFVVRASQYVMGVIKDMRFLAFRPSVIAAAIMLSAIREMGFVSAIEFENRLLAGFKMKKDTFEGCYQLLQLVSFAQIPGRKREGSNSEPGSPHGVLDASFSCNSDNTMNSPNILSAPATKKRRTGDFL